VRKLAPLLLALTCVVTLLIPTAAQPPGGKGSKDGTTPKDYSNSSIVTKMMAFNTTKDGKLTKDQVTDPRLHRLFELADTNKDGVVTKEELMALAAKMDAEWGQGGGGPGGKGKGDPFGKGGKGKGGPGGFGPPPKPGQILQSFVQDEL
jgi:hypothetical protein